MWRTTSWWCKQQMSPLEINRGSAIHNTSDRDEERRHDWNLLKSLRGWRAEIAVICDLCWRDVWGKCSGKSKKEEIIWKRKRKPTLKFKHYWRLLLITLNQPIKTWRQTRHNVPLYFINFILYSLHVYSACRVFFIRTSQWEINCYRLPQFILGLGKNNIFLCSKLDGRFFLL